MKRMIASLLVFSQLAYAGRLQDADFKTEAELVAAGSSAAQLLNDSKVYITANGLNKKLNSAIIDGDIGAAANPDNKLSNPGFEKGTTGWTESGGTFASTSTASEVFEGTKAVTWDSSSATQTLTGTAITVGGFAGQNAELTCNVRVPSGTATHTLGVWDGTTLSNAVTLRNTSGNTNYVATTINFIAPSSGTVTARFTSVASNEPSISIDDCYLGKARNIGTVQQARLIGTVKITGCATAWSTTSTTYATFATVASCSYAVTGEALAPTTNIPAIRFASLPPGEYKLEYEGAVRSGVSGQDAFFQFFDGTNTAREESSIYTNTTNIVVPGINQSITYTSPQSNVTLQIRSKVSTGGQAFLYGIAANPGVIRVYHFPSASQQAVSSAQADYDWTAYTPTLSAGFGTPTNVSFFHKRRGGDLIVKGTFTTGSVTAALGTISLPSGLSIDTTRTSINNVTGNNSPNVGMFNQSAANQSGPVVTSTGTSTTQVYTGGQFSGSVTLVATNVSSTMSSSAVTSINFTVPISGWNENQRAPTLVGSVTSNSNGAERIERAIITGAGGIGTACTSSPCTVASQSGSWITSATRSAIGDYFISYPTGTFSSTPSCSCSNNGTSTRNCSVYVQASPLGLVIRTWANANTVEDNQYSVICMGPR